MIGVVIFRSSLEIILRITFRNKEGRISIWNLTRLSLLSCEFSLWRKKERDGDNCIFNFQKEKRRRILIGVVIFWSSLKIILRIPFLSNGFLFRNKGGRIFIWNLTCLSLLPCEFSLWKKKERDGDNYVFNFQKERRRILIGILFEILKPWK